MIRVQLTHQLSLNSALLSRLPLGLSNGLFPKSFSTIIFCAFLMSLEFHRLSPVLLSLIYCLNVWWTQKIMKNFFISFLSLRFSLRFSSVIWSQIFLFSVLLFGYRIRRRHCIASFLDSRGENKGPFFFLETDSDRTISNQWQTIPDSWRHTTTEGILYSHLHNYKKDDGTKHPD
jgi:hypothetical protein